MPKFLSPVAAGTCTAISHDLPPATFGHCDFLVYILSGENTMILIDDTEPRGDASPAERVCWLMGLLDRPRYDDLADRQLHARQKWLDVIAGRVLGGDE